MAHAQKADFVFRRNGWVHLNRLGGGGGVSSVDYWPAEVCASAVVMLDTPCSEVVWRVLAINSIRQFPLNFSSRASQCAITFHLGCTNSYIFRHKVPSSRSYITTNHRKSNTYFRPKHVAVGTRYEVYFVKYCILISAFRWLKYRV